MICIFCGKVFDEIFIRLRKVENKVSVKSEHDKHVEDKIDDMLETFKDHDKEEMIKYDSVKKSLDKLFKHFYMIIGAFLLLQFLISNDYLNLS